jgi:hypothetical protein
VNSVAINMGVQVALLYPSLHSFRYMPRSDISLNHMVGLFLVF